MAKLRLRTHRRARHSNSRSRSIPTLWGQTLCIGVPVLPKKKGTRRWRGRFIQKLSGPFATTITQAGSGNIAERRGTNRSFAALCAARPRFCAFQRGKNYRGRSSRRQPARRAGRLLSNGGLADLAVRELQAAASRKAEHDHSNGARLSGWWPLRSWHSGHEAHDAQLFRRRHSRPAAAILGKLFSRKLIGPIFANIPNLMDSIPTWSRR